jgi:hypothetical protein
MTTMNRLGSMSIDLQIERTRKELHQLRKHNVQAKIDHNDQREKQQQRLLTLKQELQKTLGQDLTRRSSLGTYVSTVRTVLSGESEDIDTLQGQVCRALHVLATSQAQLDLASELSSCLVLKHLKSQSSQMEEETTLTTISLLNQIATTDQSTKELKHVYEKVLSLQSRIVAAQQVRERQLLGYAERCKSEEDSIQPVSLLRHGSRGQARRLPIMKSVPQTPPASKKTIRAIERFALSPPESPDVARSPIRILTTRRIMS